MTTPLPPPVAHRGAERWGLLALAALIILLYARSLGYWFLPWDDPGDIYDKPVIVALDGRHLHAMFTTTPIPGNYAPVTLLSYALDFHCWGMQAAGYHAMNLLWHVMASGLLYGLLRAVGISAAGAWCGSALFALHPVQVETVVWLSERKNLLATAGVLGSLLAYVRSASPSDTAAQRRSWWDASLVFGIVAILSKASAVVLPVLCVACDRWVHRLAWRESLRRSAPCWALGLAGAATAVWASRVDGFAVPWHGGSLWATLWTLPRVWLAYLRLIVWPAGLSFWYALEDSHAWSDARSWGAVAVLAGVAWCLWRWQRRQPRVLWWTVWIIATLLPTANLVPLEPWMHDRYLYLPLAGVCGLVGEGVTLLWTRRDRRWCVGGVMGLVLIALSVRTVQQVAVWRDPITLWSDTITHAPTAALPRILLGDALVSAGRREEGVRMYWSAAEAEPSASLGWSVRGFLMERAHRPDEARAYYEHMDTLPRATDQVTLSRADRALARGDWPAAMDAYAAVLTRQSHTHAMEQLAAMAQRLHQPAQAVYWYRRALRQQPWRADLHRLMAASLQAAGRGYAAEAARHLALAEAWERDDHRLAAAHRLAGAQYRRWGQPDLAALAAQTATALEAASPMPTHHGP